MSRGDDTIERLRSLRGIRPFEERAERPSVFCVSYHPFAGPHPARGSESTRMAHFRAKRATASISREESWKVVAKIFMLLLCDLGGLARKKHLAAVALLSQSRRGRKDFARGWQGGNGRLRGKRVKNSETGQPPPGSEA